MTSNSLEDDPSTFELLSQGMKLQFTDFDGEEINIEIDEIGLEENDNDIADNIIDASTTIVNVNDFESSTTVKDDPDEINEYELLQDSVEIIVHTSETNGETKSVKFICKKCSQPCDNLLSLQQHAKLCHVSTKSPKKLFQECGSCRQIFVGNSKASYLQHVSKCQASSNVMWDTKAKRRRRCNLCSAFFDKDTELLKHMKTCKDGKKSKELSVFNQAKNKSVKTASAVPRDYLCICTWCDFKANRYSDVKRHIESQHEIKSHFPCKECSFVCQTVEDYAKHFNCFHKTDEYKHACTACNFRCNNRLDLKSHYLCAHKKQRTYSCKLCGCRSQDMVTMKKHVVRIHSNPIFHCKACDFKCNMKNDYRKHLSTVHNGASGFEGECPDIQFEITDIIDKDEEERVKETQPVPETHILEEQIFDDHILDNNISSERDLAQGGEVREESSDGGLRVESMGVIIDQTDSYNLYEENYTNLPPPTTIQPGVFIFKRNNILSTTLSSDRSLD